MNPLLSRAQLLLTQERYDLAAETLRQALLQSPEDADIHRLLALCLAEQEKFDEATSHAQQAVHLLPDDPYTHYTLCSVMADRRRWREARAAIEEALALELGEPNFYAMLARIEFSQERWRDALAAAEQGLAIDGENAACINLRAMAQVKLGDKAGAAATIDQALARRPDDPYAHANQGWNLLHNGEPRRAMEHFREALRLNPEFDWARQGIVESLKARNPVYRLVLKWFLWMAKLPSHVRWAIIIGGYIGQRYVTNAVEKSPEWAPWLFPILIAYWAFALLSWLAVPFFDLLLRLHPWGRHALSRDQKWGSNLLLACLLLPVPFVLLALSLGNTIHVWISLTLALVAVPASAVFRCDKGWPRTTAMGIVGVLCIFGIVGAMPLHDVLVDPLNLLWQVLSYGSFILYLFGFAASQFAMNYLMTVVPRR